MGIFSKVKDSFDLKKINSTYKAKFKELKEFEELHGSPSAKLEKEISDIRRTYFATLLKAPCLNCGQPVKIRSIKSMRETCHCGAILRPIVKFKIIPKKKVEKVESKPQDPRSLFKNRPPRPAGSTFLSKEPPPEKFPPELEKPEVVKFDSILGYTWDTKPAAECKSWQLFKRNDKQLHITGRVDPNDLYELVKRLFESLDLYEPNKPIKELSMYA